jgi:hypothetical protein
LGSRFAGAYLHGSIVLDAFKDYASDIDIIVTVKQSSSARLKDLSAQLDQLRLPQTVSGADLALLSTEVAQHPASDSRWLISFRINHGDTGTLVVEHRDPDPMIFVDLELTRQQGQVLIGPAIPEVFGAVDRQDVLRACLENCRIWASRDSFEDPASGILTVCRAWRYLVEGTLCSKPDAGRWALSKTCDKNLISAALGIATDNRGVTLPDREVKAFCSGITKLLEGAVGTSNGSRT